MQNIDILPGAQKQPAYYDVAVCGDSAWFCNFEYAAICRMDLRTHDISLEAFVPASDGDYFDLYGAIAYYKGKLILAPRRADNLLVYDLAEKNFMKIDIALYARTAKSHFKFRKIFIIEETAYFIPGRYFAILKLDLNTYKLTYYDGWYQEIESSISECRRLVFGAAAVNGYECLLPFWQGNKILRLDLLSGKYQMHEIYERDACFSAAVFDGQYYWLAVRNKAVLLKWTGPNTVIPYGNMPEDFRLREDIVFIALECAGDKIFAIPQYGTANMIVAIDRKDGSATKVMDLLTEPQEDLANAALAIGVMLCAKRVNHDTIIIFSDYDRKTIKIELESGKCICFDAIFDEKTQYAFQHKFHFGSSNVCEEKQDFTLQDFLSGLTLC